MAFITDEDYDVQVHTEVIKLLDNSSGKIALRRAESMAMDLMKTRLSGRYDTSKIFDATGDDRNMYIVSCIIAVAIYKLYTQKSPRQIPEYRKDDYHDVIDWLDRIGNGSESADLPSKPVDEYTSKLNLFSLHKPNDNKY